MAQVIDKGRIVASVEKYQLGSLVRYTKAYRLLEAFSVA